MKSYIFAVVAGLATFACSSDDAKQDDTPDTETPRHPVVVAPSAAAVAAAEQIQSDIPGALVAFSPQTGAIARVDAAGLAGLDPDAAIDATPLVEGRGVDEGSEHSALMEYMLRFGHLYGLPDADGELAVARDVVNDTELLDQSQFSNGDLDNFSAFRARRFVQVHGGVPITGRDVIGYFDAHGGLQSVSTRLLPMDAAFAVAPTFVDAFARLDRAAIADANPELAWVADDVAVEHAEELAIEMVNADGDVGSEHPDATPVLAYRVALRAPGLQALVLIDARTGALILATDVMPSDWKTDGVSTVAGANDELGNLVVFLTTDADTNHYMAITANGGIPEWLDAKNGVSISDTTGQPNLALTYPTPLTIPKQKAGVDNNWNIDSTYSGGRRQAGSFVATITTTFDYWYERRAWRSWDGQGGNFQASFFNHKNGTTPELNAWGSGGVFQVGDGTTSTGQYLGSSREVAGHELTHNVISATTQLVYQGESGAVNEGLADLFGVAMTANRAANAYSSDYLGDDVGWNLRNMRDPTLTSQPDVYGNYVVTSSDSGGVHTNSGIINKAHTLLVNGGVFNLIAVPRVGLARVEQVIWAGMRFAAYGKSATMNEFANGNLAICSVIDGFNRVLGDTSYTATCNAFRKAYIAVGILPRPPLDFTLEAGLTRGAIFSGAFATDAARPVGGKAAIVLTDDSGAKTSILVSSYLSSSDRSVITDSDASDRVFIGATLPPTVLTPSPTARRFQVRLAVDGTERASVIRLVISNDLTPTSFTLTANGNGNDATAEVANLRGSGFTAGLTGAVLARFGGHAPFDIFDGLGGTYALASAQTGAGPVRLLDLATNDVGQYNFANGLPPRTVPTATEIPGQPGRYQVWFEANGGLDVIDDHLQVYVLVDSTNAVDESDETNNLLCVNCHAPGQAEGVNGVIVRLPKGTATDSLFPAALRAAAAKLPATYDRIIPVAQVLRTRLPFRIAP